MLTPERLAELRNAGPDYYVSGGTLKLLLAHIDAQHARIAELVQDAANAAAAERERIKAICGDVIDGWFNCAGGANEVLRRIEEYEQNGEAKP